jgi:succinate-acetate transporter protein
MEQKSSPLPAAKPWANPSPAGLVALAVAAFCFFAMLTGRVSSEALPLIGAWLLGGFVIQFIVGLVDLKSGNHTGGNTFLFFCAFFMLTSAIGMFVKYSAAQAGVVLDTRADGYAWLALTLVTWMWTPAFWHKFSMLSIIVVFLDIALPFISLTDLALIPKAWAQVAAWALLLAGIASIYAASAMVVNTACGRQIYPLPRE